MARGRHNKDIADLIRNTILRLRQMCATREVFQLREEPLAEGNFMADVQLAATLLETVSASIPAYSRFQTNSE
jgi:hypothetical protein